MQPHVPVACGGDHTDRPVQVSPGSRRIVPLSLSREFGQVCIQVSDADDVLTVNPTVRLGVTSPRADDVS